MQPSVGLLVTLGLSLCLGVNAGPYVRRDATSLQNEEDAINLNAKFKTLNPMSPCQAGEVACINNQLAQCIEGRYELTPCNVGMVCRASPKIGSSGTTVDCLIESENTLRILAARAVPAQDPSQTSLCLDPTVLSTGFEDDGQSDITSPGQSPSNTSSNNWINFCMTVDKPLTNGTQIAGGSCNPVPMGVIPSVDNVPSAKFIFPPNFETLARNQTFTVQVATSHIETGRFTNPNTTFMSAPLEVNSDGDVIGHSHIVIEKLTGFGQTTPTNPKVFTFFKGLNSPAVNGVLTVNVTGGLATGFYRIAVFHTGANHQPVAAPMAQRGATDDMVYFSVL